MASLLRAGALVTLLGVARCQPAESALSEHLAVLNPIGDPWAHDDAFLRLSERELSSAWSTEGAGSLTSRLNALAALDHHSFVDVRLVCFEGDGNHALDLSEAALNRYLEAMSLKEPVYLTAEHGASLSESPRMLHVSRKLLYHVSRARSQLCARVTDALRQAAADVFGPVPIGAVDSVLSADHAASAEAYTIYLLNPALPGGNRYAYVEPPPHSQTAAANDASAPRPCEISSWVARERYAWLDLSAGPVSFGPSTAGTGPVDAATLPRVRTSVADPGRLGEHARSALALELAATVASAASHLLAPPVERLAPVARPLTIVRIFEVFIDGGAGAHSALEAAAEGSGVDYAAIAAQLRQLTLPVEQLLLETVTVAPGTCPACEAAFALALRARSSAVVADGETSVTNHGFVNGRELQHWLAKLSAEISKEAMAGGAAVRVYGGGGETGGGKGGDGRAPAAVFGGVDAPATEARSNVLLGFVFTVSRPHLLLLDRAHQAVAVAGMAIAIRQPGLRPATLDFSCAGRSRTADLSDATRPLLGALLRAHWGVGPAHVRWDAHTRSPRPNYLWATGLTPFGPFSSSRALSFAYVDAALRARLYAVLEPAVQRVHALLHAFEPLGRSLDEVLSAREHVLFVRRWNFFLHKLSRATTCAPRPPRPGGCVACTVVSRQCTRACLESTYVGPFLPAHRRAHLLCALRTPCAPQVPFAAQLWSGALLRPLPSARARSHGCHRRGGRRQRGHQPALLDTFVLVVVFPGDDRRHPLRSAAARDGWGCCARYE